MEKGTVPGRGVACVMERNVSLPRSHGYNEHVAFKTNAGLQAVVPSVVRADGAAHTVPLGSTKITSGIRAGMPSAVLEKPIKVHEPAPRTADAGAGGEVGAAQALLTQLLCSEWRGP